MAVFINLRRLLDSNLNYRQYENLEELEILGFIFTRFYYRACQKCDLYISVAYFKFHWQNINVFNVCRIYFGDSVYRYNKSKKNMRFRDSYSDII